MLHSGIVGMKAIQPLGQKSDDPAFENPDTNIFEQGRQTLDRDLSTAVEHQAEAPQVGALATLYTCWRQRNDHMSVRRHPVRAAVQNRHDVRGSLCIAF